MPSPEMQFRSLAELKRALQPGVELEVVEHWGTIPALNNPHSPDHQRLATARRRVTKSSSASFRYELLGEDGTWTGDHRNDHVPASQVTLHDDGSWSTDYGPVKTRDGSEHHKVVRLRIVGGVR